MEQRESNVRVRYNLISVFVYIVGIVLLIQLFNLQIIKGKEYREFSNTRVTRETVLLASRGSIIDRNGVELVNTNMGFSLDLYKTKVDVQVLNDTILRIINVLEKNQDQYCDNLPIKIEPFEFTFTSEEKIQAWKKSNKIDLDFSAEETFYYLKERYKIKSDNLYDIRKIMTIRYEIASNGYSSIKSVKIANSISRESVLEFSEKNDEFPGIDIVTEPIITYVEGTLASHMLGTVGKITEEELEASGTEYGRNDVIGKTGVQYVFENYLKGKNGIRQIDMAVDGTITGEYIQEEAIAGDNVVLTIDSKLQKVSEEALKGNIEKIASGGFGKKEDTKAGAVVVMDVNSGEILAMASYPDFEPQLFVNGISTEKYNEYTELSALYNRAISGSYAPGSTFKMVTAIAGLEGGGITISETINDTGVYPHAHKPVCWYYNSYGGGHGYLNVSQAIKHSCNYFFYEVGYRIGIDTLQKYASYFGLGQKTQVELPSEATGVLASKSIADNENRSWYVGETLSAAIGQSYNTFTPIQMVKYISILANGGKQIDVTLVKDIIKTDGTSISRQELDQYVNEKIRVNDDQESQITLNEENVKAVLEGMRGVTSESGGTAYGTFYNFPIEVGGKTGSAQAGNKTNAWFVGFAPFENPEIAVVVVVENGGHGSYTAEVAKKIYEEYFGMNDEKIVENQEAMGSTQVEN